MNLDVRPDISYTIKCVYMCVACTSRDRNLATTQ